MLDRFRYLGTGIAVVLVLVGVKMIVGELMHIPEPISLGVILLVLGASVVLSLRSEQREQIAA
jgi:tellurite resistance protein TerC